MSDTVINQVILAFDIPLYKGSRGAWYVTTNEMYIRGRILTPEARAWYRTVRDYTTLALITLSREARIELEEAPHIWLHFYWCIGRAAKQRKPPDRDNLRKIPQDAIFEAIGRDDNCVVPSDEPFGPVEEPTSLAVTLRTIRKEETP